MLFIHPMRDYESRRIGMQKCYPVGYNLHAIGKRVVYRWEPI